MRKFVYFFLALLFLGGCAGNAGGDNAKEKEFGSDSAVLIPMPEVPSDLTSPEERAAYLVEHFWENMDFKDTVRSHDRTSMEQNFVNFLGFMGYVPDADVISRGFSDLLKRASVDDKAYAIILETADQYLDDPNSPMLSEELYIIYLNSLLKFGKITEDNKIKKEYRLEQAMKNRVGTKAADFKFTKIDGSASSLYKSLPSSGNLLLVFFNPECDHCDEILEKLVKDAELSRSVEAGEIKVLAIYPGVEESAWKEKAKTFPPAWEAGTDDGMIDDNELYYFPAMPTIYMLDPSGQVVGKDIRI